MILLRLLLMVLPVFFLVSLFTGPAFPQEKSKRKYSLSVELKPFYPNELKRYGLEVVHPYAFDLETLDRYMRELAYQKKRFSWSTEKRMFPAALHDRMVNRIAKRFTEVGPNQRVVFTISNPSGKTMLHGDTFLTKKGLHWRLTVLQGSRREIGDFSVAGEIWRLVPRKNLDYLGTRRFDNLDQKMTNWLVFTKVRPEMGRMGPGSISSSDVQLTRPKGAKERLKILQDLKKEGLITEGEYNSKRKEILDGL